MDAFEHPWDIASPPAAARGAAAQGETARPPTGIAHPGNSAGLALPPPDDQRVGRNRCNLCCGGTRCRRHAVAAGFRRHRGGHFCTCHIRPAIREKQLSVEGCRILARQFRERMELRQARAAAPVGQSLACPFDLHALLPVPASVLQLGPKHPEALAWLAAPRGIIDRLRQVAARPNATTGRRLRKTHAVIGCGFFTDGETPHAVHRSRGYRTGPRR
jgi:hypothetical protein